MPEGEPYQKVCTESKYVQIPSLQHITPRWVQQDLLFTIQIVKSANCSWVQKWGPNKAWPFRIGLFWGMFPKTKDWKVKIHKQFKSYGIPRNQPSDHPENTTWSCGACRRREPWRVRPRTDGWCNNGVDEGHDHDKDHHNGNNKGNKLPC